jgi:DNA-binding MarR family transcriptional regulator
MAKPFKILLYVEEVALGTVLRKVHEMPGVAKVDFDLGTGGQGEGREQLQHAAALQNGGLETAILKLLRDGPMHVGMICGRLGLPRHSVGNALARLRKKGLTKSAGHGQHQLKLTATKAKPAKPHKVKAKAKKAKRAARGTGPALLQKLLAKGPKTAAELREGIAGSMSPKALEGVLRRAKRDGLAKANGDGRYHLTAKGTNAELEVTNG